MQRATAGQHTRVANAASGIEQLPPMARLTARSAATASQLF
jgi:hypothetical protein